MSAEALLTLGVVVVTMSLMVAERLSPDVLLFGALAVLLVTGIVDLAGALRGFSNPTLLAIGSLYVVAAGLRESGTLERTAELMLGGVRSVRGVLARLTVSVAAGSAFLNNTPIVAMGVPVIRFWSHRNRVSSSKLLMPLSFASILGGLCTLIGTSTNLVTDGLLRSHELEGLGFFELAWVGVPCAIVGLAYLVFLAPAALKDREDIRAEEERKQAALVELEVGDESDLEGRSVEEAGLEHLPGLDLVRIGRGGREIGPVAAKERLSRGDHLFYAPGPEVDTSRLRIDALPGLELAVKPTKRGEGGEAELHEAVVREGSGLIGSRIADADFPERFGAAVTGVRRQGREIEAPLGEIRLRAGDTLMLDTGRGFREAFEDASEFYVATEAEELAEAAAERRAGARRRMIVSVGILLGVVGLAVSGLLHIAVAGLLGAVAMVALGLLTPNEARRSIDWSVLLVIGAAFGIAEGMESSGAAGIVGDGIVGASSALGPIGVLGGVIVATMVLTGLITNNAAAALMFPIALSVAEAQSLDPRPLMIGITFAASLALWTPLGYQTNLMVYGPGNYRFADFTRFGLPLQILLAVLAILVIPRVWPF